MLRFLWVETQRGSEHVCGIQLQQVSRHRERSPKEVFCSMRSLYQGTEPSMTSCTFWLKPLSWLRMRMMMSSMYSWLGVLYEVLYSLHSNAEDDVKCSTAWEGLHSGKSDSLDVQGW